MGAARFSTRAVFASLALTLVAVPFALLLFLVQGKWDPLLDADEGARDSLHSFAVNNDVFVRAMKTVSFLGTAPVYWVVFGALVAYLVSRGLRRQAIFVAVTMIGSPILNGLVKQAVDRARPVLPDPVAHAGGLSFPSGHAQSVMVAMLLLTLVFLPTLHGRARVVFLAGGAVWVLLMGFSRVALGVHYVSDVLAGYVLGAAWVATTTALFSAWRRDAGRPPVDPSEGLEPESAGRLDPSRG